MSDLAATNCGNGCGCEGGVSNNNSCLWIIILLLFCGGLGNNGCGCGNGSCGCGNGVGGIGNGSDCSCIILILLLLCCGGNCFCCGQAVGLRRNVSFYLSVRTA